MTVSELVEAVEHGAHSRAQIAAEVHEPQWSVDLDEGLHQAVLTLALVVVGPGRYDVPGGVR